MRKTTTLVLILAAGTSCKSAPEPRDEQLITRQSEPLQPRPMPKPKPAAQPLTIGQADISMVDETLAADGVSSDSRTLVGLDYGGEKVVIATYVRYPAWDEIEELIQRAVEDEKVERCESVRPDCSPEVARGGCELGAYETCLLEAYGDKFAFYSAHHGLECGVIEASRYRLGETGVELTHREVLEEFACDVVPMDDVYPAAVDIDRDGGPEIAQVFGYQGGAGLGAAFHEALVVFDASDLHLQAKIDATVELTSEEERAGYEAGVEPRGVITSVEPVDEDGDQLVELRVTQVQTANYCAEIGWSLGDTLVEFGQESEGYECRMEVVRTSWQYDVESDTWSVEEESDE